jgi:NADH-quinone oxidoreductase subunit G
VPCRRTQIRRNLGELFLACTLNGQGRVQRADKIHNGGIPVRQETGGTHPPRIFRDTIPGGDPLPAWQILADLLATIATQRIAPLPTAFSVLQKQIPALAAEMDFDQVRILPRHSGERPFLDPRQRQGQESEKHGNHGFELVLTDRTFGTEYLSAFSPILQQVQSEPFLHMHPADADALGWRAGESIRLTVPDGHELILPLETAPRMARGILIVARHRNIQWQRLLAFEGWVPRQRLQAVRE